MWLVAVVVEQKWCSAYWLLLSVAGSSWYILTLYTLCTYTVVTRCVVRELVLEKKVRCALVVVVRCWETSVGGRR